MEEEVMEPPPKPTSTLSSLLLTFAAATCLKLLLIPSYRSTDFEVHRHWLALTNSLPLSQWYSDDSSPWTLDYPPFFAFFELLLSYLAALLDPQITLIHNLNYHAHTAVVFQRVSVCFADVILLFGVFKMTKRMIGAPERRMIVWGLVLWSPMLLIVDHVHFQYNGMLLGVLLVSLGCLEDGRDVAGGFVFAVLLCFKHLFAVAGPVYFVYLLRRFLGKGVMRGLGRVAVMGSVVVGVFAMAYGPFMYHGQMKQVIQRMFPFGRGLCHAYWAPNFWVFYILLDKVIAFLLGRLGFNIRAPAASFTGGLVGDSSPFAVLPQITPVITFILVLLALSPCLIKVWRNPRPTMITRWVAYAYTCGFLFGWHVHEKASLHFVIPLAVVAVQDLNNARHYFFLSIVSCYSLFPLLYEPQEYPIKVLLLLLHSMLMWLGFSAQFTKNRTPEMAPSLKDRDGHSESNISIAAAQEEDFVIGWKMGSYLVGLLLVEIWGQFLHPIFLGDKLPFLPLMLISVYCSIGIMYSFLWQLKQILVS